MNVTGPSKPLLVLATLFCFGSSALAGEDVKPIPFPSSKSPGRVSIIAAVRSMNKKAQRDANECQGDNKDYSFEESTEVLMDTPQIYTFVTSGDYACGGAHPDEYRTPATFDATTGKAYSPLSLYVIGKKDKDGRILYEPEIRQTLISALIDARKPFQKDDDCLRTLWEDTPPDALDFAELALGQDGLHVYPQPAHVIQACYDDIVLPYSTLEDYVNPGEATRLGFDSQKKNVKTSSIRDLFHNPDVSENKGRREAVIQVLSKDWSNTALHALDSLFKAKNDFLSEREFAETYDDGVPSDLAKANQREDDENDFLDTLLQIDEGNLPSQSDLSVQQLDKRLNSTYRSVQAGDEEIWLSADEITKTGVRDTERLWIAYRDAWVHLVSVKYPQTNPNSLLYALNQHRLGQLSELAQLRQSSSM
jgi:uncharacterized protein YecT (DUF1311 family)